MKFIAIIPARYASSRFPGKPLADIAGKPMIQHVFERASSHFEYCYVATDDKRIAEAVELFGGKVLMTSADHRSGTDRCTQALEIAERISGQKFDVLVNIQGDEPFLNDEHIEKIKSAFDRPKTQIATLFKRFGENEDIFNPNTPKLTISKDGFALYFSRSVIPYIRGEERSEWHLNYPFLKHIGLYAYRTDILREITALPAGDLERAESLEQLRWLENGYRISVVETTKETIAIDTPEDYEKACEMLR